ncbi:hypothetical protein BJY16_003568 [Actinoplanes octamycinicus]|uniref:Integral membrane protein n=1 Tax=Actinoplanes octamycinicus TaxID=135948 RepID=A0A7W7GXH3_9ACTN|nr:hypothetical protein [Actinoplanes octamycinicus]MBB4740109.1 hypothetical protein [Actinoplanes octamycinicus]GIE59506.1 hypothetical protein Aoc01nite_49080 [Actinoplanes octamycinicus]
MVDTVDGAAPVAADQLAGGDPAGGDAAELDRLRAEVASLRAQLTGRPPVRRRTGGHPIRGTIAAILAAIAAFALVTSVVGLWAARTTLNTDRYVATVTPLPQDPAVSTAVAAYATTQLFEVVDVDARLRAVLPPQAGFVVGPLTGQLREQVDKIVTNVLRSDRFQPIWVELNRRVHQRVMAVLNGDSEVVTASSDKIQIDLLPLINQAIRALSDQLPTMFGKTITLPDLSSGEIPANLRERVSEQLGVTLPANFAQFTVYDSGQLYAAQQAVVAAKRYLVLFVVATVLLVIAAFLISPRRRRTAVQLGIWLVVAAVAITAILRAVRREVLEQVPEGVYRNGVDAAMTTVFSLLRERGQQIIWIGALLAVLAYLVGPGRFPVWLRHQLGRGGRAAGRGLRSGSRVLADRGPGFVATYLDPLRIIGVVIAAIFALILSSWTSLLVILILLAAYEVAITLVARRREEMPAQPV